MPARTSVAQRFQLFDHAVAEMGERLLTVRAPEQMMTALRARMFATMLGLDEAIEAAGYDERSYDFGSALHEALTNSLCLVLWLRRQPAFPDTCLADAADRGQGSAHSRNAGKARAQVASLCSPPASST